MSSVKIVAIVLCSLFLILTMIPTALAAETTNANSTFISQTGDVMTALILIAALAIVIFVVFILLRKKR